MLYIYIIVLYIKDMSLLQDNVNEVELGEMVRRKLLDLGFRYNYNSGGLTNKLIVVNKMDRQLGYFSTLIIYSNGVMSLFYPIGESECVKIDDIDDLNLAICRGFDKMREFARKLCRNQTDIVWEYSK